MKSRAARDRRAKEAPTSPVATWLVGAGGGGGLWVLLGRWLGPEALGIVVPALTALIVVLFPRLSVWAYTEVLFRVESRRLKKKIDRIRTRITEMRQGLSELQSDDAAKETENLIRRAEEMLTTAQADYLTAIDADEDEAAEAVSILLDTLQRSTKRRPPPGS